VATAPGKFDIPPCNEHFTQYTAELHRTSVKYAPKVKHHCRRH